MGTLTPLELAALPPGTSNAQALARNASDFDRVINGISEVTNRTGKGLLSLTQALALIGYEVPVAFGSGLSMTRASQTVVNSGLTYHANPASLPFTTTGTFNPAQWLLISNVTAQDLLDTTDPTKGAAMIGYRRTATASAARTVARKLDERVTVLDFEGGDTTGVLDSSDALDAAIAHVTSLPFGTTGPGTLFVTFGRYKVTRTINATCNVEFEEGAHLRPSGMAPNAVVYNIPAGAATTHIGVYVFGDSAVDPANGTVGISVNSYRSELTNCGGQGLKYGALVKTFSVSLTDCNFNSNYCNLAAYAPNSGSEINDLKVFGGNYATVIGGGKYAIKIGDRDFATSVLTTNAHGNNILLQGFALDGGAMHIDSANQVKVDTVYFEGLPAGQTKFVEIGTSGFDGLVNNVKVDNCLFKNGRYAVYSNIASRAIYMRGNQCTAVTASALYLISDIYPAYYEPGLSAGSFTEGKEVHTGCRSLTMASELFGRMTMPSLGLYSGVQDAPSKSTYSEWFGPVRTGYGEFNNYATSGSQRFYTTPAAAIAGHVSDLGDGVSAGNGLLFKCTTLADCYQFNGGDYLTGTGPLAGSMYVRRVDYENGIVYLYRSGGPTNGAATISQAEPDWFTTVYRTAVPASGDWKRGDRAINSAPTVGQPKSWVCTVTGTPGTWVSEGNL